MVHFFLKFCMQAVNQLERLLQEAQEQKDALSMEGATGDERLVYIENKTFCKLGHFHLLLEDYEKGRIFCKICNLINHVNHTLIMECYGIME